MPSAEPKERNILPALLLTFLALAAGIIIAEVLAPLDLRFREMVVLLASLILCAGAVAGLWWRHQRADHYREKFLAMQTLGGSEARYRSAVNAANDAIVTIDAAGKIIDWNDAAGKIFHYTADEMRGQALARILPPAAQDHFFSDLQRIQAGGSPINVGQIVEMAGQRKDGSVFPMEVSVTEWQVSGERYFTGTMRDITERKRAEENLRLQSGALTAAANGIVITRRDGTIVWVNPAFSSLTGFSFAEAVGRNPRDLIKSGQQEAAVYEQLWQTILAGRVWCGELINRRKDGSHYHEEVTITPLRDAAGEITHFVAIKQDLTERKRAEGERKQAEEEVRASQQVFQAVFEQAAVGVVIAGGPEDRFMNVNRRFCEMVGYPAKELLRLTSRHITHPEDVSADADQLGQISSGVLRKFNREKRFRRKDGTILWAEVFVAPLDPAEANPTLRIGVIADITERKQAEERLKESEERYRLLFENNPLPMWLYDVESLRFLAVNESAVRHYGYSREEFLGLTIREIRPPEDLPVLLNLLERGRIADQRAGEYRHRRKDGTSFHVEVISRPLVFEGCDARLVLAHDITERKLLEEKFLHAQRLESLGMLAAGIAHDLNNVLAPIVFAAPMLRENLSTDRDLRILNTIELSAGRGAGLVKQILGFAHTSAGEFQPTQVKHLARDIISMIEETFPKTIRLKHEIPTDLWLVQGNATQIHQVLLNLCVNARDAMPDGGTLRITMANRVLSEPAARQIPGARPGAWLVIEVADSGTGIAPGILDRVWNPFFTTKGAGKGTGLGLSTVRGIVAQHQGAVELHTQPGQGTTFRVFLPAVDADPAARDTAPAHDLPSGHGELILVVDDNGGIRDTVAALLRLHGYNVLSCGDGVEAASLFLASQAAVDLVLTDVDMPQIGGAALARTLLELRPDLRLVVMSGLSRNEPNSADVESARKLAHAFLLKPFQPEDLLRTVHGLLHPSENK